MTQKEFTAQKLQEFRIAQAMGLPPTEWERRHALPKKKKRKPVPAYKSYARFIKKLDKAQQA